MTKLVSKLITEIRTGNIIKYPTITLNNRLAPNYNAFLNFRNWFTGDNKQTKDVKNSQFNNVCKEDHDYSYNNYLLHRKTFNVSLHTFDMDITKYRTFLLNVPCFPSTYDELQKLIQKRNIKNEIVSENEKLHFCLSSLTPSNSINFDGINAHQYVEIFKKYEKNNIDGGKLFKVQDINYIDGDIIRLKCVSINDNKIKFIHGQYHEIITDLDMEIIYFRNNFETKRLIYEKYAGNSADKHHFEIQ